jgi:hypothetical protein
MAGTENHRETGARKYPAASGPEPQDEFSQDAAGNSPPPNGIGLTQPLDETSEDTKQSEGVNPPRRPAPGQASEKVAGPATAERPKDAKAPHPGPQPGAGVKGRSP